MEDLHRSGIHLSAPDALAVQNNIAEVTGSAELDVTGTPWRIRDPSARSPLDEGGRVRIQSVDHSVTPRHDRVPESLPHRSALRRDHRRNRVGSARRETEGGLYEVTVNVTGTLDRITPTITSDPASDITLFSIPGLLAVSRAGHAGRRWYEIRSASR